MPAAELFTTHRTVRSMSIELEDLTLDLLPYTRLTIRVTFVNGVTATLLSKDLGDDSSSCLGEDLAALVDGFMFGEGAKDIIAWCQKRDRSQQSRRVRRVCQTG